MADSLQQKVRNRKLIYALCIVVLFTASLIHRKFVIVEQAKNLLLREVDRGEVELTGSAVRLLLTGSRGLAVTMLWNRAVGPGGAQEKHKWNEVELLVNSITELQPYFITPWLFQSWNLAFNVAVENDRPRDKYYYVTRGLERLAAGERRNAVPGNPDLRHSMGVYLQMKIGTSDEKMTMRSLLDLSTIDPVERDADVLLATGERGREINQPAFRKFCRDYPRLVRRLREQLGYNDMDVIDFLAQHRELPGRFSDQKTLEGKSVLKDPIEQWPILPPKTRDIRWKDWPDSRLPDFGLQRESFDIFMVSRTWHAYSQENVPPPDPETGMYDSSRTDPMVHRLPRRPTIIIFRGYPARAQLYMAETLQEEGWFDAHGSFLKDWFPTDNDGAGLLVGDHPKYHSGDAFARAFERYREYGRENGMFMDSRELAESEELAGHFRKHFGVNAGERAPLPANVRDSKLIAGFRANEKLNNSRMHRSLTNFDGLFYESEAKSTSQAVAALKLFHMAEQFRKMAPPVDMLFYERNDQTNQYEQKIVPLLKVYDRAIELWLGVLLRYPNARRIQTLQEDTYEAQIKFIRYFQEEKEQMGVLRPLMKHLAGGIEPERIEDDKKNVSYRPTRRSFPLVLPLPGSIDIGHQHYLYEAVRERWTRIRDFRGPFDMTATVAALDESQEQALKDALAVLATAGKPYLALHPHLPSFQLSLITPRGQQVSGWWSPVVNLNAVNVVRNRFRGLQPDQPPAPPEQPPQP
jgi:hypothetical protein